MSNASSALTFALGAGGGLLAWHLLRDKHEKMSPSATPATVGRATAHAAPPRGCAIRLDPTALTADGTRVSVVDAVDRCKAAARADVTLVAGAPAATYAELMIALGRAGVPTCAYRNAGGTRPGRQPRRADVVLQVFVDTVLSVADEIERAFTADGRARGRFGDRKVFIAAIRRALGRTEYARLSRADVDELLLRAHREGLLALARADLVAAMDPDEVHASEVVHPDGATFHFFVAERARNADRYTEFTLITYPQGRKGRSRAQWFRAEKPIAWAEARDRIVAAGIVNPEVGGRTYEPGGWMLSVDPRQFNDARAERLPGGERNAETASTFTLVVYPQGDRGPKRVRWFHADPPTTWDDARDRLAAARLIDRRDRSPHLAGAWQLVADPRVFDADRAKPLPGGTRDAARAGRYALDGRTILRDGEAILRLERVDLSDERYAITPHATDVLAQQIVDLLNRSRRHRQAQRVVDVSELVSGGDRG